MVTNPSVRFKHAFVTGATGIVGSPLCEKIAQMGIPVTAYSRASSTFSSSTSVKHTSGDILDIKTLRRAANGADVIFHLAAAVHNSLKTFEEYKSVNVDGTQNVIRVARAINAQVIHVSTVNVDGFLKGEMSDDYARTKSQAEDLINLAVGDGLNAVIVRPATVFGNQVGSAGLILDRVLGGSLKVLPAPSRQISPVWSFDLASALIKAAENGQSGRIYTIAGPTMTTADFVTLVAEAVGTSLPLLSLPGWFARILLELAWRFKGLTRWTPPVSPESLNRDSIHDGGLAAKELGFSYTSLSKIFCA